MIITFEDRLLWCFSTAPQLIAALAGLSFTAVIFKLGLIDKHIRTNKSIASMDKSQLSETVESYTFIRFKKMAIVATISISMDLVLLVLSDKLSECKVIGAGLLLLNICTIWYQFKLCLTITKPNYIKNILKSFIANHNTDESVDIALFNTHFEEFEHKLNKAISDLQMMKPASLTGRVKCLQMKGILTQEDVDNIQHLHNFIISIRYGNGNISKLDKELDNQIVSITQKIKNGNSQ